MSCRRRPRRLLLVAAADPSGDPVLVRRAAGRLGIMAQAAGPAVEAGLLEFRAHVSFRHPLVRSAAYRSASPQDRQEAHRALAEVTDPRTDPDRRAWHRAKAAAGPDEQVAAELESSAGRAQARSGLAAAAAFLERAVVLTVDPARRAERALAAAQASLQAGAFGKASELLATAEAGPLDELQAGRADLLRGQATFVAGLGSDAPPLLLKAAKRLEPLNLGLARETYLSRVDGRDARRAAGRRRRSAGGLPRRQGPARAGGPSASGRPDPGRPGPAGHRRAGRRRTDVAARGERLRRPGISEGEGLRWGWFAQAAASALWDEDAWHAMLVRQVRLAHDAGALDQLPIMLGALGTATVWSGDFAAAALLIAQADAVCEATGSRAAPFAAMMLASLRGDQAEADPLIEATIAQAAAGGQGNAVAYAHWVAAILANGLGRYEGALAAARHASEDTFTLHVSMWALPELVEAAARTGNTEVAAGALERLAETTRAGGTDFGLGLEARCRALLSDGAAADELYREAIDRLGRTRLRPELARAHLLYGEWLRREGRRADARGQLRTAHDMFAAIGMEAFAGRARRELIATGEKVPKRSAETRDRLTPQEEQIARLAREGRTSPEIGAQLFLSARTVEWHLGKVFTKLGIGSRRELQAVLAGPRLQDQPA